MSEHLFLFSATPFDAADIEDSAERQPLEDVLIRETGVLEPGFRGLVAGFVALASFDL